MKSYNLKISVRLAEEGQPAIYENTEFVRGYTASGNSRQNAQIYFNQMLIEANSKFIEEQKTEPSNIYLFGWPKGISIDDVRKVIDELIKQKGLV